ncbi:MAG: ABC transporter ATP-binding protein [Propionicimonas sp.]
MPRLPAPICSPTTWAALCWAHWPLCCGRTRAGRRWKLSAWAGPRWPCWRLASPATSISTHECARRGIPHTCDAYLIETDYPGEGVEQHQGERTQVPSAIRVRGLVKEFGTLRAVDGVDLDIPRGSFYGIAGPNGAGKSTTLRMLTGLLRPDDGTAEVHEISVWPNPARAKAVIGFVPDNPVLFDRLTAPEMLQYAGMLRRLPPDIVAERSAELLQVLDLVQVRHRLIADYSLGMLKRIGLGVALLHNPRVMFLDEPFGALDPVNAQVIEDLLQRYRDGGGTVVFASHVMDVVQRLCDRVVVIDQGRVMAEGTVAEVAGGRSLQDAFVDLVGGRDLAEGELTWLSSWSD